MVIASFVALFSRSEREIENDRNEREKGMNEKRRERRRN